MKIHSSVIWIKAVTLIGVLLMNTHRADMTLDEVEATLQFEITTDASPVKINPEGPLNFLRGYIYQKMECMYNKRFFAPQIDTEYFVKEDINEPNLCNNCSYVRDRKKDKAYTAQPTNKMDVFSQQYHNHLIDLFPSPTGDITIETRGNQSFIQFLRAETTKEHSLQILAMLLLFSEGVDIPIKVTNTLLEVYESRKKDKIYFTVPMEIDWLNTKEERVEKFKQKKVKQIISFFQENATNREVLSLMMDKCTKEEVMSGKFLDSPKFLIQSYIFGFIGSAELAIEFIQTVHTMAEKYAPKTETPRKGYSVYDRLFKPTSTITRIDTMALMKDTEQIISMYKVFPFANSTEIPAYKSVPRYTRETNAFSTDRLKDYSNCVECMILSLFCCLAYDPAEGIYRTDHMGNVSKELKEFFSLKNQIFDTTKAEFQKEWCRVVADLNEPRIAYCKERNELDCGIINMLMVISEIVNAPTNEKDKILGFSECLKEREGELDDELCDKIQEYTKTLLKRLSKTEDVEIELSEIKTNMYNHGRYDISGDITMSFKQDGIKNTIVLGISHGHSTIDMEPIVMDFEDERMEKMSEIANRCKSGKEFIGNLFSMYVEYEARKLGIPEKNKEFMKVQVRKTIENNFTDINRLLLVKKINDLEYKKELISSSIIYTMDQKFSPEHPITRFTSNVLGSMELDNFEIQLEIVPLIVFIGQNNQHNSNFTHPRLILSSKRYMLLSLYLIQEHFLEYILDCNMNVFTIWIRYVIDRVDERTRNFVPFIEHLINRNVCQHIFRDGTMTYADLLDEIMEKVYPSKKEQILSVMHMAWVVYLSVEESPNIELIKMNLDAICDPIHISHKSVSNIKLYNIRKPAIKSLNMLKKQIFSDKKDVEKVKQIISIL